MHGRKISQNNRLFVFVPCLCRFALFSIIIDQTATFLSGTEMDARKFTLSVFVENVLLLPFHGFPFVEICYK